MNFWFEQILIYIDRAVIEFVQEKAKKSGQFFVNGIEVSFIVIPNQLSDMSRF